MLQRLQKILSERGVCSRRKAEEYLERGLIRVNGIVVALGTKADPSVDTIDVDGKVLSERQEMLYYLMMKPVGVETSNVPSRSSTERTVRDLLPPSLQGKVFPVGRLDKDSSGLLLFTNDGVLAYRLTHPRFHHEKEYEVTVERTLDPLACKKIEDGFVMDGYRTKPLICTKVGPRTMRIILTEGKNRQIRRMVQYVGYTVQKLERIRIMTLMKGSMKENSCRALTEEEKSRLLSSVGVQ